IESARFPGCCSSRTRRETCRFGTARRACARPTCSPPRSKAPMCGISGTLAVDEGYRVDPELLARMRDTLAHRGPDGAASWLSDDGRVGLAFRRLAIIDLSETAMQPMENEDGAVRVVFNGEIYNHLEIRRELQRLGHRFRTDHSDTEVIVHGFEAWGIDV